MELYLPPVIDTEREKNGRFKKGHKSLTSGYKHAPETIEHLRRVKCGDSGKPPMYTGKPVVAIKNGKLLCVYPGASVAACKFGVSRGIISRVCRGERKTYQGIQYFYEDDPRWLELIKE